MNNCKNCKHENTAFCDYFKCSNYEGFEPNDKPTYDQSIKSDANKYQPSLVPIQGIKDVAEVRAYGVAKYGSSECWRQVESKRKEDNHGGTI